jgi:hypothetical protein
VPPFRLVVITLQAIDHLEASGAGDASNPSGHALFSGNREGQYSPENLSIVLLARLRIFLNLPGVLSASRPEPRGWGFEVT